MSSIKYKVTTNKGEQKKTRFPRVLDYCFVLQPHHWCMSVPLSYKTRLNWRKAILPRTRFPFLFPDQVSCFRAHIPDPSAHIPIAPRSFLLTPSQHLTLLLFVIFRSLNLSPVDHRALSLFNAPRNGFCPFSLHRCHPCCHFPH